MGARPTPTDLWKVTTVSASTRTHCDQVRSLYGWETAGCIADWLTFGTGIVVVDASVFKDGREGRGANAGRVYAGRTWGGPEDLVLRAARGRVGSIGDGGGVDGELRNELTERALRRLRAPTSCPSALCASGESGGSGGRCTFSPKTSKTVRTGEVACEARREGLGERFANGSSSRRSGGGELREGVTGPTDDRGEGAPE